MLDALVTSWGYAEGTGGHSGFDAYLGRTTLERRMQWQGTRDIASWLTVPAAIDFQARHDWPAVRDVGRKIRDRAVKRVASACVVPWPCSTQARLRSRRRWRKKLETCRCYEVVCT